MTGPRWGQFHLMLSYRQWPLWGPLAGLALSLAWLLPNTHRPWVAFHKDAYIALILLAVGSCVCAREAIQRKKAVVPAVAVLLGAMAIAVWLQHWINSSPWFLGETFVGSLYLAGAAAAVMVGCSWERQEAGAPARFIFLAFLLGSGATAAIMLAQWLELSWSAVWFTPIEAGDRVVGNLNQPNNAATLLLWGLVALFWLKSRQRTGITIWLLASLPLIWCLVLTGSRINFIALASMLLGGNLVAWRSCTWRTYRLPLLALLLVFGCLLMLHSAYGQHLVDANPFDRQLAGARLAAYQGLTHALMEHPWLGFGMNQTVYAQLEAAHLGHRLNSLFSWSHNIFLDIALWFGIPAAAVSIAVLFSLTLRTFRERWTPDRLAMALCLGAFGLHASVELPHGYAVFLLPACFMLGVVSAPLASKTLRMPTWSLMLVMLLLGAGTSVVIADYLKVEKSFFDWRFKIQHVGTYHPMSVPDVMVLDQFHSLISGFRSDERPLSESELESFRRAVIYFPSPFALQHLAKLQVRANQLASARETVRIADAVLHKSDSAYMRKQWLNVQRADETMRGFDWSSN